MNEEYVVGLIRVSLAEVLKMQKRSLGNAFMYKDVETAVQIMKSIHNTEEALRDPNMEIIKDVVKAFRK